MSLASRAGDLYFSFRFLKLLTTPWKETDAFKLGIVDENGKRIKSKSLKSDAEKSAYTPFHRLVYNIKRLITKIGGGSQIASYASAFFLLREHFDTSDKSLNKIMKEMELDPMDFISEKSDWYLLEDKQLAPGIYKLRNDSVLKENLEDVVYAKDKIRVPVDCYPKGNVFGLDVYECIHINTNRPIYISLGEIYK